ncbi:hypothetical protein ERIC2_10p00190 (plasmid) [Paenibacillus larvae subsp. larvae DSM 25430]|uniref:Uncharacterized protein n=1 Tax=Paenibacillus larvae subsp. larvae DSM 25430 TaxID=697284 RepID=V9WCA1_9BACL|nr:hypothetical protein ERIC2_10p00190 [Paenibacillus larvae subsp. larvae DSM 25430]
MKRAAMPFILPFSKPTMEQNARFMPGQLVDRDAQRRAIRIPKELSFGQPEAVFRSSNKF